MNIILDLDGTLVQVVEQGLPLPRPYLHEFLEYVFGSFNHVAIWSASGQERIQSILDEVIVEKYPFYFVWSSNKITVKKESFKVVKKLKKVFKAFPEFKSQNTLILDDTPSTYKYNYGNAVSIDPWYGDPKDDKLVRVMRDLERWKFEFQVLQNVHLIQKYPKPTY